MSHSLASLALLVILLGLVILGALAVGAVLVWLDYRASRQSTTTQP